MKMQVVDLLQGRSKRLDLNWNQVDKYISTILYQLICISKNKGRYYILDVIYSLYSSKLYRLYRPGLANGYVVYSVL